MPKCLVCHQDKSRDDCHIIVLTEKERTQIDNPLDEYPYCKPCWGVLSDRNAAPSLISGIAQHYLRQLGVGNAAELAQKFKADLIAKSTRRS